MEARGAHNPTPDTFVNDPTETSGYNNQTDFYTGDWITRQWYPMHIDGNGLVYHSDRLSQPLEIAGRPRLQVWMSMDTPDADFWSQVYEVTDEGASILLGFDLIRARYRGDLRKESLLQPGQVERYEFVFPFTARQLGTGSRIRLVISPLKSTGWERNRNSGKPVAEETGTDACVGRVLLHHDEERSSVLLLPIIATAHTMPTQ